VDAIESALDKIVPKRVRFWRKNPMEDVSASMNVPSGDAGAAVVDKSVEVEDTVDCSKDGTCDTGDLYDGDQGENEEGDDEVASASTVDATVGNRLFETDNVWNEDEEEFEEVGEYEEEWGGMEDDEEEEECFDSHEKCDEWVSMGECEANAEYMLQNCKKSCMICGDV
jgi:hypothetical protein